MEKNNIVVITKDQNVQQEDIKVSIEIPVTPVVKTTPTSKITITLKQLDAQIAKLTKMRDLVANAITDHVKNQPDNLKKT